MTYGVIVAGGKQSRMDGFTKTPKVLLEFNGKSNLKRLLENIAADHYYVICNPENGFQISLELTGYNNVTLLTDYNYLGSGGCLSLLPVDIIGNYIVVFGDVLIMDKIILEGFINNVVVEVHHNNHPQDSDSILGFSPNGVFHFKGSFIHWIPKSARFDLVKELIVFKDYLVTNNERFARDFGTPERYKELVEYMKDE